MTTIQPAKSDIDIHKLAKLLGGTSSAAFSCATIKKMKVWQKKLAEVAKPRIGYKTFSIRPSNGSLQIEDGVRFTSIKASKMLNSCTGLICFAATIGSTIEEKIARMMAKNRFSDAYILDAIGSVAVENVVEQFHHSMKRKMRAVGRDVTYRLSPGYCDWPLQEQKKLFKLLDTEKIGIGLTDSCLMQPRKSVSGIFGILKSSADMTSATLNPCSYCSKRACSARRTGPSVADYKTSLFRTG